MVYLYNGILFKLKEEGGSGICLTQINLEDAILGEER